MILAVAALALTGPPATGTPLPCLRRPAAAEVRRWLAATPPRVDAAGAWKLLAVLAEERALEIRFSSGDRIAAVRLEPPGTSPSGIAGRWSEVTVVGRRGALAVEVVEALLSVGRQADAFLRASPWRDCAPPPPGTLAEPAPARSGSDLTLQTAPRAFVFLLAAFHLGALAAAIALAVRRFHRGVGGTDRSAGGARPPDAGGSVAPRR